MLILVYRGDLEGCVPHWMHEDSSSVAIVLVVVNHIPRHHFYLHEEPVNQFCTFVRVELQHLPYHPKVHGIITS